MSIGKVWDFDLRLCRRMSMIRMPRRARAAIPPTTAPTMTPIGVPEPLDSEEDVAEVSAEDD